MSSIEFFIIILLSCSSSGYTRKFHGYVSIITVIKLNMSVHKNFVSKMDVKFSETSLAIGLKSIIVSNFLLTRYSSQLNSINMLWKPVKSKIPIFMS